MSKIKQIKTALIGAGIMGKYHARQLHEISDFSVVCDPDFSQAKPLIEEYNLTYVSNFSEIPKHIDSVVIAAPTNYHESIAIGLLSLGKNILIEKPLSKTYHSGEKILEVSSRKGLIAAVGHIERFNPVVQEAKKRLSNGEWGDIISISARRFSPFPSRIGDVGVIFDIGIHDIDLIRYLFEDEVIQVSAFGGKYTENKYEDYASIQLKFKGNKIGYCETNWLCPVKVRKVSIITSTHYVILDLLNRKILQTAISNDNSTKIPEMEEIKVKDTNALKSELINFLKSTVSDEMPLVSVEDGLASVRVAEQAVAEIFK